MNKNIVAIVGFILVAIIAWQGYLLNKQTSPKKPEKEEPKITVEIEKPQPPKTEVHIAAQTPLDANAEEFIDRKKIEEDLKKLFHDLFGNPKVQAQIRSNIEQIKREFKEGITQLQSELANLSEEFQKSAHKDPFLAELFGSLKLPKMLRFEDKGDYYAITLDVPGGKEADIDIRTKKNLLIVTMKHTVKKETNTSAGIVKKEVLQTSRDIILIPKDAFIDKLDTQYKEGKLYIIVPKAKRIRT